MNEKILIVEDNPLVLKLIERAIAGAKDAETKTLVAVSAEDAIRAAKRGDLTYCALDLEIPEKVGAEFQPVGIDQECRLGFFVLKTLLQKNPFIEVRILSRHTDFGSINALLAKELGNDPRVLSPLDKNNDKDYLRNVSEDVKGMTSLRPVLDDLRIRVVHPLERRFARKIWRYVDRTKTWNWPTPIFVIRGEPRSGKDRWAYAFGKFRDCLNHDQFRVDMHQLDCGRIASDRSGDSAEVKLFGTRNYQHIKDAPGLFERASYYNTANHRVDYQRSSFVLLSELGNLPANGQRLLLEILDSNPDRGGRITRAGAGNQPQQIGCGFIFTTNAQLENRVARSDAASEGEIREDLFERLTKCEWLFVPSFVDMGVDAFLEHLALGLRTRFKRTVEIAPIAESSIRLAYQEAPASLSQHKIDNIVEAFATSGDNRVTADHITPVLRGQRSGDKHVQELANRAPVLWSSQQFEEKLPAGDKRLLILQFLIESSKPATRKEIIEAINLRKSESSPLTTSKNFNELLSRTRDWWSENALDSGYVFMGKGDPLSIEVRGTTRKTVRN